MPHRRGPGPELWRASPIVLAVTRLFAGLERLSLARLVAPPRHPSLAMSTRQRMRRIDAYIMGWLVLDLAAAAATVTGVPALSVIAAALAAYRLLDIGQAVGNVAIFDNLRHGPGRISVAFVERTLLLLLLNYLEVAICFGVLYSVVPDALAGASTWFDPFYFSVVTQTTLGFGDVRPVGAGKALAAVHGMTGVVFGILVLSRFLVLLPVIATAVEDEQDLDAG